MELQTIGHVSKAFNLSTRTLRYYEQIGLIESERKDGYAYRVYSENTINRLKQIVILRKLQIPLKQIAEILQSDSATMIIEAFQKKISEIDEEITSLSTVRDVICSFITRLNESISSNFNLNLLDNTDLIEVVDSIAVRPVPIKEEKTAAELHAANVRLNKLTDKDVRIVYLPPSSIATYQYIGDDPEMHCRQVMDKFVIDTGLTKIKPDLRHFGFNAPNPDETGYHGYEMWVTIPDNMEVPEPIVKKNFEGGLYAAHMIPFGTFEEWDLLNQWVSDSDKYEYTGNWDNSIMFGWLEEHLNYFNHVHLPNSKPPELQLDLLIPIREIVQEPVE